MNTEREEEERRGALVNLTLALLYLVEAAVAAWLAYMLVTCMLRGDPALLWFSRVTGYLVVVSCIDQLLEGHT